MKREIDKVILFDMDGTLAGYEQAMKRDLERLASPGEPPVVISRDDSPEWLVQRMRVIKLVPGWWRNLPRLQDGFDILNAALNIGYKPQVLTKGPTNSVAAWTEKLQWCRSCIELADAPVTITETDKSDTYGRVLVDDWPPFMEAWLQWRPRGLGIMPAREYNAGFKHPNVVRYDGENLGEVKERLRAAYDRK
jgi:5'-nucleotidase